MSHVNTVEPVPAQPRGFRRVLVILGVGVLLIAGGVWLRGSTWARETWLKSLSPDELALAVHDHPNDALVLTHYGSALLKNGLVRESEAAFRRAVEIDPKLHAAQLGVASVLLRSGSPLAAVPYFEAALRLKPKDVPTHMGLAQAWHQSGSPSRAIPSLQKITEVQPKNSLAWYHLGKLYGEASQSDKALEAMEQAARLDPSRADYWRDLGKLNRHYSRLDKAEEQYRKALELNPEDPVTHYWLGQLLARDGATEERAAEAETHFRAALKQDPNIEEVHFELGQLYQRRNNWKQAAASYQRAHELDRSSTKNLYQLGTALVKLGRTEEGEKLLKGYYELLSARQQIESLENRAKAQPNNPELHLRLARVYRKYGNLDGAQLHYEFVQRFTKGDGPGVQEAQAFVQSRQKSGAAATVSTSGTAR